MNRYICTTCGRYCYSAADPDSLINGRCPQPDCAGYTVPDPENAAADRLDSQQAEIERLKSMVLDAEEAKQQDINECCSCEAGYEAELERLRAAISRYCHNDCYRDSCEGNEDVGIPDCPLARFAPDAPKGEA